MEEIQKVETRDKNKMEREGKGNKLGRNVILLEQQCVFYQ